MATRTEVLAANGRAVSARISLRDLAALLAVVFAGVGALSAGMQWAVSTNLAPLLLEMQAQRSEVVGLGRDIGVLRSEVDDLRSEVGVLRSEFGVLREEVGKLRTEVEENRNQIADLRERVAKVEVGLAQVQANQARILELLDRERTPRG